MSGKFGELQSRSGKKKERCDSAVLSKKSEKDSQTTGRLGPRESSADVLSSRQASGVQESTEKTDQAKIDSVGQDAPKIDMQQIEFEKPKLLYHLPSSKRKNKEKDEEKHKEEMKKDLINMFIEKIPISVALLNQTEDGKKNKENQIRKYEDFQMINKSHMRNTPK